MGKYAVLVAQNWVRPNQDFFPLYGLQRFCANRPSLQPRFKITAYRKVERLDLYPIWSSAPSDQNRVHVKPCTFPAGNFATAYVLEGGAAGDRKLTGKSLHQDTAAAHLCR